MINSVDWIKSNSRVAVFAAVCRLNVIGILASCDYTVVAELAVSSNPFVIKHCILPGICAMTIIADITTLDVSRIFTCRNNSIMAALAFPCDSKMINSSYVFPISSLVAKLAIIGGSHMAG
jgi:hypothetical protein